MLLEESLSETMDSDSNVQAMGTDSNVHAMDTDSKPLNTGPNEVAVVTSLRDAAKMGAKGMSVDESHHSEAVTPSQTPAPTVISFDP